MADLNTTRKQLKIAFITMGVVDLVAIILLFSPLIGSLEGRLQELDQTRSELQQRIRQVSPLYGLDKKIVTAGKEITGFYDMRLAGRYSAISESLGKLAGESGVQLEQEKYSPKEPEPVGLQAVTIDANLSGDYLQLVRFINSLERNGLFFMVDSVDLGGEQGNTVKLHMKLRTFLKAGA